MNHEESPKRRPAGRTLTSRHSRKCSVCRHPERHAIEQDYIHWHSPDAIARDYNIADHSSIYRHVNAFGLRHQRYAPARAILGSLLERADEATVTGNTIVRAVWAFAHLNEFGQWIEDPPRSRPNRQTERLENAPTH